MVTYHPDYQGLFLATGGSGHGFKFLPVIGNKIADRVERKCPEEFKKWAWPKETVETVVTEDGSRGGRPGMVLDEELAKGDELGKERIGNVSTDGVKEGNWCCRWKRNGGRRGGLS